MSLKPTKEEIEAAKTLAHFDIPRLLSRLSRLNPSDDELTALRKDKARLDAYESLRHLIRPVTGGGYAVAKRIDRWETHAQIYRTLREAIDAATAELTSVW